MALTQSEGQVCCLDWQRILRLLDWDVKVLVVPAHEIEGDRARVYRRTPNKRHGVIRITDPAELEPQSDDADWEVSLVHELLHFHLWEMTDALRGLAEAIGPVFGPVVDVAQKHHEEAEERAVYHLAYALVNLKRGYAKG